MNSIFFGVCVCTCGTSILITQKRIVQLYNAFEAVCCIELSHPPGWIPVGSCSGQLVPQLPQLWIIVYNLKETRSKDVQPLNVSPAVTNLSPFDRPFVLQWRFCFRKSVQYIIPLPGSFWGGPYLCVFLELPLAVCHCRPPFHTCPPLGPRFIWSFKMGPLLRPICPMMHAITTFPDHILTSSLPQTGISKPDIDCLPERKSYKSTTGFI